MKKWIYDKRISINIYKKDEIEVSVRTKVPKLNTQSAQSTHLIRLIFPKRISTATLLTLSNEMLSNSFKPYCLLRKRQYLYVIGSRYSAQAGTICNIKQKKNNI